MVRKYPIYIVLMFLVFSLSLTSSTVYAESSKPVIIIDPAHGGNDIGVLGVDQVEEKDVALAIALAMQKELAKAGNMEVVLTRDTDKTMSLDKRKQFIEKLTPALVMSLHVNAGFGKTSSGFELYYPGFKGLEGSNKKATTKAGTYENQHLNDTVKLARLVQRNLDGLFPRKGRGLREAGIPLAEGLKIPILVVEIGFITNPEEKKKLTSEKTQMEIAKALARSIKAFF